MPNLVTESRLSLAEFQERFQKAAAYYSERLNQAMFSTTDAAVASIVDARLPMFSALLHVISCLQHYTEAVDDQLRQQMVADAYVMYNETAIPAA